MGNQVLAIWGLVATEVVIWLPRLVAADCGLEFSFYIWTGRGLFAHSERL